jgi:hypothetical protein
MHIRRPPSGDGPKIYRPNESVAVRLDPPPRPVAYEPESIPPTPRDTLLSRVNRRRGQILTAMVSVAAIASFGSVVWWAHNQDVKAGGKGLEPLVVQASQTPTRIKPENAGGLVPPNQDKEVYNRIQPNTVPVQPEKLLPAAEQDAAGRHPAHAGRPQGARGREDSHSDADRVRRGACHDGAGGPRRVAARYFATSRRQAGDAAGRRSQHRQPDRQHVRSDRRPAASPACRRLVAK